MGRKTHPKKRKMKNKETSLLTLFGSARSNLSADDSGVSNCSVDRIAYCLVVVALSIGWFCQWSDNDNLKLDHIFIKEIKSNSTWLWTNNNEFHEHVIIAVTLFAGLSQQ